MFTVFLTNTRVNAQGECIDKQINLVNVFSQLGNSPVITPNASNTFSISASGVVTGGGLLSPDAVSFSAMPIASDQPQYGYALLNGSTTPVLVTVFAWRIGPKPNQSGNGFNNFWAEISSSCSQFQDSYGLTFLQYKAPKGSATASSWDVSGGIATATASNCVTPAGTKIVEWQSISNTQGKEAYAVAILKGRYQVSINAKAYVRIGSGCCYYKAPNGTTFGIECIPEPFCAVDDPTVVGSQCNTQYPVTLKISEYEDGSKYQGNTFTDGQGRQITESYSIAWYRYSGGNPASGTLLGSAWTLTILL